MALPPEDAEGSPDKPPATGPEIRRLVQAVRREGGPATEIKQLKSWRDELAGRDWEQDIELKKWYALALLIGLGVQLVIADGLMLLYAWGADWKLATSVVQVWLAATVVEVVGVVFVVTRYLFPPRDT